MPLTTWITRLFARRSLERDLAEEIRQHLDEKVDDLMAGGVPRDEAVRRAHQEFGNRTLLEERGRDVWRWHLLEDGWADLRYALRQLRRSPAFALAAVVTLALGIGSSTAMFSVVNAVVLRPLPFPAPDRLVSVESRDRRGPRPTNHTYPTVIDFRSRASAFARIVIYRATHLTLTGRGLPVHLRGQIVSWDFFQTLGVEPAVGRAFVPNEEEPGARVVILSHDTWVTALAGDPAVIGQRVSIDGEPTVVVGSRRPVSIFHSVGVRCRPGRRWHATGPRGPRRRRPASAARACSTRPPASRRECRRRRRRIGSIGLPHRSRSSIRTRIGTSTVLTCGPRSNGCWGRRAMRS